MIKDGRLTHVCRPSRTLLIGVAASLCMIGATPALTVAAEPTQSESATAKPNIVVIWGDDVGFWNVGAYSRGMMGYQTPNIDRIANEGALFTDTYAQQSCTAGRAAFILGQSPFRTGLLTIGVPGSPQGITKDQPTIAELLKPLGSSTSTATISCLSFKARKTRAHVTRTSILTRGEI
jgi:arylsulfatase